jgi:hypothetical protein
MCICTTAQQKHIFLAQMRRRKKIKMVCKGKTFAHRPMRISMAVFSKEITALAPTTFIITQA